MDLQTFSTVAGLISLGIVILGAFYVVRMNVGKSTSDAQSSAIAALQAELISLRNRVGDAEKENQRLEQIVDTVCAALKTKGIVISIQGEMVIIQDGSSMSTARIHDALTKK